MPQLPFILAIEPDRRQSSTIASLARNVLHTELQVVETADDAAAAIARRVPDLILTSLLLSPKDEATLSDTLRELDAAGSHVQTLVIPVLASTGPDADGKSGLFSRLRRNRSSAATPEGCDPAFFGTQIEEYLERAAHERAVRAASPVADTIKVREIELAPQEPWNGGWTEEVSTQERTAAITAASSWDDPFSVTPPTRRSVAEEAPLHEMEAAVTEPAVAEPVIETASGAVESVYLREVLGQPAETMEGAVDSAATSSLDRWQASPDEVLVLSDEPDAGLPVSGVPSEIIPQVGAPLIIEPTSYASEAFAVAAWDNGETSVAPSGSLETTDGLEVLSVQTLSDEGWEDVRLEATEAAEAASAGAAEGGTEEDGTGEAGGLEYTSAAALAIVEDPLPTPPEPIGSIDLGTFVSALEAADQAAREIKGHSASSQPMTPAVDEIPSEPAGAEASEDAPPSPRRITIEPFIVPPLPRIESVRHTVSRLRPSAQVAPTRSAVDEFLETVATVTEVPFLATGPLSPDSSDGSDLSDSPDNPDRTSSPGSTFSSISQVGPVKPVDTPVFNPYLAAVPLDVAQATSAPVAAYPPADDPQVREAVWRSADRGIPTSWPALAAEVTADAADSPAAPVVGNDTWLESLEGVQDDLELLTVLHSARSDVSPTAGDPDPIAEFISALAVADAQASGQAPPPHSQPAVTEAPVAPKAHAASADDALAGDARASGPADPPLVEVIQALRKDIEVLETAPPAERLQPAPQMAHRVDRAANNGAAPTRQGRRNKKSRKHRAPEPPPAKVAVQDEWGFFDPAQCGFSALLAKLDELSSTGGDASWSR